MLCAKRISSAVQVSDKLLGAAIVGRAWIKTHAALLTSSHRCSGPTHATAHPLDAQTQCTSRILRARGGGECIVQHWRNHVVAVAEAVAISAWASRAQTHGCLVNACHAAAICHCSWLYTVQCPNAENLNFQHNNPKLKIKSDGVRLRGGEEFTIQRSI